MIIPLRTTTKSSSADAQRLCAYRYLAGRDLYVSQQSCALHSTSPRVPRWLCLPPSGALFRVSHLFLSWLKLLRWFCCSLLTVRIGLMLTLLLLFLVPVLPWRGSCQLLHTSCHVSELCCFSSFQLYQVAVTCILLSLQYIQLNGFVTEVRILFG